MRVKRMNSGRVSLLLSSTCICNMYIRSKRPAVGSSYFRSVFVCVTLLLFLIRYSLYCEDKVLDDQQVFSESWTFYLIHWYTSIYIKKIKTGANMAGGGRYHGLRGQRLNLAVTIIAGLDFA